MKKKRFYNDKKRNQKWTEEEKGRKIDFADKYIEGGASDKFDYKRPKQKGYSSDAKTRNETWLKRALVFVCCVAIIAVGYTGMDVYITRHAEPAKHIGETKADENLLSDMQVNFSAFMTEGISLDNSVMLSAVINEAQNNGFTAIAFEAKRADGTIGYNSTLASVDTFSAMSSPASKPEQSIKAMLADDILPVAKISCYKDNVVPLQADSAAIMNGKKPYKDGDGNTYLNPDSEYAYNYIRDIIAELNTYGVTVFILDDVNLPEDISANYGDGFETLSKKLYSDIDSNIKLLQAVNITLDAKTAEKDVKNLNAPDKNQAYIINTTADNRKMLSALQKKSVSTFVLNRGAM
ncbi:MAG: hypothetical protein IKF64_02615 [Eubacterium sp.]|nr:hypothetical protein [Eubacterium sp.]